MRGLVTLGSRELSRELCGGKAASLSRLVAAGFRVPPGFVLTVEAVREREAEEQWPASLREELVARFRELTAGRGAVAVRSSGVAEDSAEASFAGQHETILDVRDEGALLDAINACLASLHSEAAVEYRRRAGIAEERAAMAVVIQRMVPAECAGVAFGIDPTTGDDAVIVEAVTGTGEALVSGIAEADRWVLDRATLQIVDEHHPGTPVLDENLVREIAGLTLHAGQEFGGPQDVEFAVSAGNVWMLQSRPVTTASIRRAELGWRNEFDTPTDPSQEWTSANVQEVLPGLLTPYTLSAFGRLGHDSYTALYHQLGLLDEDDWPLSFGFFHNRAYLNMSTLRTVTNRFLGGRPDSLEHRFFGAEKQPAKMEHSWTLWRYRLRSAVPVVRVTLGVHKNADRAEQRVAAMERRVLAEDPASLSDLELWKRLDRLGKFSAGLFHVHLAASSASALGFETTALRVEPVLGEETEAKLPVLFSGLQNVESAGISLDLWALSRIAIEEGIVEGLAGGMSPRDASLPGTWRRGFDRFLARHGHRGINEVDPAVHPWRDDPVPVVRTIVAYAALPEEKGPAATLKRQRREREALEEEILSRMNPVARRAFRWFLGVAQRWVASRERTKSIWVRSARLGDRYLAEARRRFLGQGLMEREDDFFFLSVDDVEAVLRGRGGTDYRTTILQRRREYERNRHITLPERFFGHPVPAPHVADQHARTVLKGTPVSPGQVTGRAHVINDPAVDGGLEPGEILVAPVTDAGWTPLFALAAGLVVDIGSALSHGSTVAREYGLPAVVNVRRATQIIRSGDLVAVDGGTGTVAILEAAGTRVDEHPRA